MTTSSAPQTYLATAVATLASVKPGVHNTGPTLPTAGFRALKSQTVTVAGSTISSADVVGGIVINTPVNSTPVKIDNVMLNGRMGSYGIQVLNGSGGVVITNSQIRNCSQGGIFGNNWTAQKCKIFDMGSDATDGGGNNLLESCWISRIGMTAGSHSDGFQSNNGTNIIIQGNFFDLQWYRKIDSQEYHTNSCVFLNEQLYGQNPAYLSGTIIDSNWFVGGNFCIYALQQVKTTVSNSFFDTNVGTDGNEQFGIVDGSIETWTNNMDIVAGTLIDQNGDAVKAAA